MKSAKILAILVPALAMIFFWPKVSEAAPMGTTFTYQGHLYDANYAANGLYDFQFKLYDANSEGVQLGSDVNKPDVDVIDAYFTVELDFNDPNAFNGDARWLEIGVRPGELEDPNVYAVLLPRQEVTPTPYAIYAETAGSVTEVDPIFTGSSASAIQGTDITNWNTAYGWGDHSVVGYLTSIPGSVMFEGENVSLLNNDAGYLTGYAETDPTVPANLKDGVSWTEVASIPAGFADNVDNTGITSESDTLSSVCSRGSSSSVAVDISGTSSPMLEVTNTDGTGGNAIMGHTNGDSPGVRGSSNKGHGVYGITAAGSRHGVYGNHNSTVNSGSGGYFRTSHAGSPAVWAYSKDGTNYGIQCDGYSIVNGKLEVYSNSLFGGLFRTDYPSTDADVVHAEYTGSGGYDASAVFGHCAPQDYYGLGGYFEGGYKGVQGVVQPTGSNYYYGVRGYVSGGSGTNYGIYGSASGSGTNWAGYFAGNVNVTGTLSKGAGSFKIDHPLDPENKYLSHSFVESPDMMNVYNGNVVLDENGTVVVEMPDWFDALNRDYRYQLTCIGGFAPVYIAEKIQNNSFKIAGGTAGLEVSWQVTGIRQDPYAEANRIPVEEDKKQNERGKYLHPVERGLPIERSINALEVERELVRDVQNVEAIGE